MQRWELGTIALLKLDLKALVTLCSLVKRTLVVPGMLWQDSYLNRHLSPLIIKYLQYIGFK